MTIMLSTKSKALNSSPGDHGQVGRAARDAVPEGSAPGSAAPVVGETATSAELRSWSPGYDF